jgi:hypothetical protein
MTELSVLWFFEGKQVRAVPGPDIALGARAFLFESRMPEVNFHGAVFCLVISIFGGLAVLACCFKVFWKTVRTLGHYSGGRFF